jgi:hypothetical protein
MSKDAVAIVCETFVGSHLWAMINAPDMSEVQGFGMRIPSSLRTQRMTYPVRAPVLL